MLNTNNFKNTLIILVCLMGIIFAIPNLVKDETKQKLPGFMQNTVNLGLELRGGSHLQLEVDMKQIEHDTLSQLVDDVRLALRKEKIGYSKLAMHHHASEPVIHFESIDNLKEETLKKIILTIDKNLFVTVNDKTVSIGYDKLAFQSIKSKIVEQSIEVIRRRVDETGTTEPIIQKQGEDRIILQLPGVQNPAEVRERLGKTAKLTFHAVDSSLPMLPADPQNPDKVPTGRYGVQYMPEIIAGQKIYIPVYKKIALSGDTLTDAQVNYRENSPAVSLVFNTVGTKKFALLSKEYLGKPFAIVLDNQVLSAPRFNSVIPTGRAEITGNFDVKAAAELSLLLRAGALPAPLKIIDEKTIGPSLGSDSIKHGQTAVGIAFILVSAFMIFIYGTSGVFAVIGLFFNMTLLFAALSLLGATLTLPGIAGIALTIGMAVDANVLIFERIKEEIRSGNKLVQSIENGYRRAMMTIIDSNLTTLFGASLLFMYGSGPIRGFAVTLALGIIISLFTSLSLSKFLTIMWIKNNRQKTVA
ncbi:MAG: protein translocase subunit SecD [Candidatus Puniceispirillum sp.]|nr:protein translocase subunit SecD [Candidatus Pelagibacter sp.]MBA4282846.1 protein translocase subunit SecD [Candidatus Puniceispirillum sp.]